jgi:hypothetical protein
MSLVVVEFGVLKIYKMPIQGLAGFADHYYLSETPGLDYSVGWGASGIELRGVVKVTPGELDRINKFISVAKYNIAINNCEHFANYVLHGINLSSQQHTWWKCLSADIISLLQPAQSIGYEAALPDTYGLKPKHLAQLMSDLLSQYQVR